MQNSKVYQKRRTGNDVLYNRESRKVPVAECKKLSLRLDESTIESFREYCRARKTTAQQVLEKHVKELLEEER